MARKVLRGVEYICDGCGAITRVRQMRTVLPEGWIRLTVAWTIPGTLLENHARQDLCPTCAQGRNLVQPLPSSDEPPRLRLPVGRAAEATAT